MTTAVLSTSAAPATRPLDAQVAPLFTPFSCKSLALANRFAMAPMTRSHSPGGIPGDNVAAYYARRAKNGVGLILTEGTAPATPEALNDPNVPHFYGDAALAGWKKVERAVHAAGGLIMPQLWHVGMRRKPGDLPNPEARPLGPSGIGDTGQQVNQPMTDAEIERVIAAYATSAASAERLGFDGIELHGAHGYLIDQFFYTGTNHRTDRYGGGIVQRTRFGCEVVQACRRAVSPDFPIFLRFSQWKGFDYSARLVTTPEELAAFLEPLVEAGVDVFHCSTRRFWEPEFDGSRLNLAGWTKKLTGKPTITVGSVGLDQEFIGAFAGQGAAARGIEELVERFERGEFDLVAVGRAVFRIRRGSRRCVKDARTKFARSMQRR